MDKDKKKKLKEMIPEEYQLNLGDFTLFPSVMKNKCAYECILSIILDEPKLEQAEVRVEQVIRNSVKKARDFIWKMELPKFS